MVKRFKDKTNLISKTKIKTNDGYYYYDVFLWKDKESFDQNTVGNIGSRAVGCVNFSPQYKFDIDDITFTVTQKKLGEIHFIKDKWNMEIVSHEACHALINRLRMLQNPKLCEVIQQKDESEEEICYEFGRWVNKIYGWLWKYDGDEKE